uniref:RRM domain-containing protein n=1 Tax=Strigamia maritima TaxID=126957 RepID=T1JN81_STRMM
MGTPSKETLNKENLESPSEGDKPVRKRKWGSSTANTNKKTSIAISTDSLKCLIPDVKPLSTLLAADNALDFNEGPISDVEDSHDNLANKEVRIVRTISQAKKEGENDSTQNDEKRADDKTTTLTKPLSVMDEPVNRSKSPSPARNPVNRIVHIRNLVRPFTINQLKELLGRTGTLVDGGFWTDKIKSKCYATYETQEQAMKTRQTLHGTQWPPSNPKNLIVDFADDDELQFHMSLTEATEAAKAVREVEPLPRENLRRVKEIVAPMPKPKDQKSAAPPPPIREWDRVKIGERSPGERERRKRSMSPQTARDRKRERGREGKEKKERKVSVDRKKEEEAPAKLLDDLFKKTKSTPCIYWLPLTLEQFKQRDEDRKKRQVEREKRRQLIKKEVIVEKERSPVSRDLKKPKRTVQFTNADKLLDSGYPDSQSIFL